MRLPRRSFIALAAAAMPLRSARAARDLRVVTPGLPNVLDPHLALTPLDRAVAAETFLGLVARDGTPALAESWTVSPDGITYTFALRADARWSDGSKITAQDVVFSFQRALNPATAAPFAGLLGRIVGAAPGKSGAKAALGVQAVDRETVRIALTMRAARFIEALAHPVAAVVPRAILSRAGTPWLTAPRPVCSGPFIPVEQGARLERNPNAALPAVADSVRFESADSFEAALERIRAGAADLALGFAPEPVSDRNLQRSLRIDRGQAVAFVAVNLSRPKLGTREIRHALGMLIDRDRLIRTLRIPNAIASYAPVPPDVKTAPEAHPAPYHQISADDRRVIAQVLLQEETITPQQPATFRFLHAPGRVNAAIAGFLNEGWAKAGVQIDVQARAGGEYVNALMAGDYDLALVTSHEIGATAWPYLAPFTKAAGPDNLPHYAEDDFETHMETAAISLDANGVSIAIGNAEGVLAEDQIVIPLFAFRPGHPVGGGVGGWESNATGIHPLRLIVPRS